jgi:hypothetical protein
MHVKRVPKDLACKTSDEISGIVTNRQHEVQSVAWSDLLFVEVPEALAQFIGESQVGFDIDYDHDLSGRTLPLVQISLEVGRQHVAQRQANELRNGASFTVC